MQNLIGVGNTLNEPSTALAAAYVRMSTEHQQYSTENQLDTIRLYSVTHDLEISKVYTDAGISYACSAMKLLPAISAATMRNCLRSWYPPWKQ